MFESLFQAVKRDCMVDAVSGGLVPLPASFDGGAHLFINCVLPHGSVGTPPTQLLRQCRIDAGRVAELTYALASEIEFKNLCISFFDIPTPGQNIRVYRSAISKNKLLNLTANRFHDLCDGEESNLPLIRDLIESGA